MITSRAASTKVAFWNVQAPSCSAIPSPMAAANVTGRLVMLAMTAAVRVWRRRSGPPLETLVNEPKPRIGTRSSTASADSTPVIVHTMVERRCTGSPSSFARSPLSAAALMATP